MKVRIYKSGGTTGKFISGLEKFISLPKAKAGMQAGQDMMSAEDRIIDELKSKTSNEDIADILENEYGVQYYEGLNMIDDVIDYVYDDYANEIKNAELSDSELIPDADYPEEPEAVKKPPLYDMGPWISDENPEEGFDDYEEQEEEEEEEEEDEDISSNKSKPAKQNTEVPVSKKGGTVNKGKFVKKLVRGLHKAAEGVEQQSSESSIMDTPIGGREAHLKDFKRGILNLGNEFYAKKIYDQTKILGEEVKTLPSLAQEGMEVDTENAYPHHLQAYSESVGNIFKQPYNQVHGAGYENLPEARRGREQRQADRQQRQVGKDFRNMFGDMAVGYSGVPGMPNYLQMISPQIQTGPASTEGTQVNRGPGIDIEYKKGPWWSGKREWSAKGIPAEMLMGMPGGGRGMPGGSYYGPGRTSSSSWSTTRTYPGEIIRDKVKSVNSKADPTKNNETAINNNPVASSDTYFKNEIPGFVDYNQDWAGNFAKANALNTEAINKSDAYQQMGEDPSQYGYMIDPATGEVVKNPKGTDVDQRGLVWSGQYDDRNTPADESLVWSNPASQEEYNKDPNVPESYIVTNPDGTQSSMRGITYNDNTSQVGSEFSNWYGQNEKNTNESVKTFDQKISYLVNMPKDIRAKNYKELNESFGEDIVTPTGDLIDSVKDDYNTESYPVTDYPFATPSKVTTQNQNIETATSSSQPQSNQANTQTQSNPQTQSTEEKGSGDMTAEFTSLKNTGLGVLDQWDAYNQGLKGLSARVIGKGQVDGMIDDSRAKLQAVSPADFCSQDIDGQIADIQKKKKERAGVLTPEDLGYLSQIESMLNSVKSKCTKKQFGGPVSGAFPDEYGNLQKFVYGGDEDLPISPIVAYDNNDIQSKNVDDPFQYRQGGLYRFEGENDSETNPYNLTNPTPNAQTTNTVGPYQTPAYNRFNPNATSGSNFAAFNEMKKRGLIQTNYNPNQSYDISNADANKTTTTTTNTNTNTNTQNQNVRQGVYPTAPGPMRQLFDMFNPIKKDFTYATQRDYARTADGQIFQPPGQTQTTQGPGATIDGTTTQGQVPGQAGYYYDSKYTKKGPFWNRQKTLELTGKWIDPNNPGAGVTNTNQPNATTTNQTNTNTSTNTDNRPWQAPMVLPNDPNSKITNSTTESTSNVDKSNQDPNSKISDPNTYVQEEYGDIMTDINELVPEAQAEYDAFLKTNPSKEAIDSKMDEFLLRRNSQIDKNTATENKQSANAANATSYSNNPMMMGAKPSSVSNTSSNAGTQYNLTNPETNPLTQYQSSASLVNDPLSQQKAWNESGYTEPTRNDPNYHTTVRTRADQAWKQQGMKVDDNIEVQNPFDDNVINQTRHRFSDGSPALYDYETGRYNPATVIPEREYGGYVPEFNPGGQFSGSGPFDPNAGGIANGTIGPCTEEQVVSASPGDPCYNAGYSKGTPKDFKVAYDIKNAYSFGGKEASNLKNLAGFGAKKISNIKNQNYNDNYLAANTTSDNIEVGNEMDYQGLYSGLNQRIMSKGQGAGSKGVTGIVGQGKRGGELKYKRGGVYDLTQEEVGKILAAGGQIKFIK